MFLFPGSSLPNPSANLERKTVGSPRSWRSRGHPKAGAELGSPNTPGTQLFARGLDCTEGVCTRDARTRDARTRDARTRAWLPRAMPAETPTQAARGHSAGDPAVAPVRAVPHLLGAVAPGLQGPRWPPGAGFGQQPPVCRSPAARSSLWIPGTPRHKWV